MRLCKNPIKKWVEMGWLVAVWSSWAAMLLLLLLG
jgi:hypothetical protein